MIVASALAAPTEVEGNWEPLSINGISSENRYSHPLLFHFQSNSSYDLLAGRENGPLLYQHNQGSNETIFEFETEEVGVFIDEFSFSSPTLLDFNSDGEEDILIGDATGNLHLMVRNGLAFSLNNTLTSHINVTGYAKPTAADINSDNLIDLIVGDIDGRLTAFINSGTSEIPQWEINLDVFRGIRVGDYASPCAIFPRGISGLPDFVIGTAEEGLTYLRNKGITSGEEFPTWDEIPISDSNNPFKEIDFQNETHITPFLIDLEGDSNNFLDLVVGNQEGTIEIFQNHGIDLSDINPSPQIPIFELIIFFALIVIPITIGVTLFVRGFLSKGTPIYLMILHSSGISPYSFSFTGEELEINTLLAGGAFVGIQSLVSEITKSPELKSLDAGSYKILITKIPFDTIGGELQILLFATDDDEHLRKECVQLAQHVVNTYQKQFRDSYFDEAFTTSLNKSVASIFSFSKDSNVN